MSNKNLMMHKTNFWTDWDGVATPPTVRQKLGFKKDSILCTLADKFHFSCVITNSDPRHVFETMGKNVQHSNLNFIGEHGACARFSDTKEWETHPDLTVDLTVLPDLAKRAHHLLTKRHNMTLATCGEDLQKGERVIRIEQKMTSFCLVRTMNGFNGNGQNIIADLDNIITDTMDRLSDEFQMKDAGWGRTIGSDAQEFSQDGFSKKIGIEWATNRFGLSDKTDLMFEDGNEDLLKWLSNTRNAFNFAVRNELPLSSIEEPHIFANIENEDGYWQVLDYISNRLKDRKSIDLDCLKTTLAQPRHPALMAQ